MESELPEALCEINPGIVSRLRYFLKLMVDYSHGELELDGVLVHGLQVHAEAPPHRPVFEHNVWCVRMLRKDSGRGCRVI